MAEKRLIDANALVAKLNNLEAVDGTKEQRDVVNALLAYLPNIVDRTPTVDAVEVVRCKDCQHGHNHCDKQGLCTYCQISIHSYPVRKKQDDFCSCGERKMVNLEDVVDIEAQTKANNEAMRKVIDFMVGERRTDG